MLAPTQLVIATITNDVDDYAVALYEQCRAAGLRVELDTGADKIGYKVRQHSVARVPVMFVVGKQEAEQQTVAIRRLGSQATQTMGVDAALALLQQEITEMAQHPQATQTSEQAA